VPVLKRRQTLNQRKTPPIAASALAFTFTFAFLAFARPAEQVKEFEMTASRFEFQPATIEVTEGDHVKLTLRSSDTTHGFAIPELQVKAKIPKGGAPVTAEFVAEKPGTFVIKCSEYCGPGHKKMKGTLVVAPRER
jgi:heme/copper-type cytochrome/quinol oxidase subunit 2